MEEERSNSNILISTHPLHMQGQLTINSISQFLVITEQRLSKRKNTLVWFKNEIINRFVKQYSILKYE